jgi:outer membrane protein
MKTSVILAPGLALLVAAAAATSAGAQAAAATAVSPGPPIPGFCILSVNQAISTSTVGQYVHSRMEQIVAQVKAELGPEDTAIANDGRALEAQAASLDQATRQQRYGALQQRANALREKADLRQREVQATEQKALNRMAQELDPIARQIYQQKHCSVLADKGSIIIANPDMDITPQAVAGLNAKIQQFPFDREHLDAGSAGAARR